MYYFKSHIYLNHRILMQWLILRSYCVSHSRQLVGKAIDVSKGGHWKWVKLDNLFQQSPCRSSVSHSTSHAVLQQICIYYSILHVMTYEYMQRTADGSYIRIQRTVIHKNTCIKSNIHTVIGQWTYAYIQSKCIIDTHSRTFIHADKQLYHACRNAYFHTFVIYILSSPSHL